MSKRQRETTETPKASLVSSAAEISFPRGGGSILTSLEKKQISNEVKKDLLFSTRSSEPPKKKSRKVKSIIAEGDEETEEEAISIDRLSVHLLQPGSMVLGQIRKISQMEIVVSLADDMTGFLPITNISDEITTQLEDFDDQNNSDSDMDVDSEVIVTNKPKKNVKFPELENLFKVGQWISAQVVSNVDENQRKRIELTIEPSRVNGTIDPKDDIVHNYTIQASVKSIEDHGYILNFGSSIKSTGFIPKKDAANVNLQVGAVVLATVVKSNDRTVTCTLSTTQDKAKSKKLQALENSTSVDALLPGVCVNATITETSANGIIVKAYGICDGFVNCDHLNIPTFSAEQMKERFTIGANVKARIIAVYMKNGTKKLELSLLPQILALETSQESLEALEAFPIGHIFDSVTVRGKDYGFIFLDVRAGTIPARAHKSKIGNNQDIDMDFKIGSEHKARILNYSSVDNTYIVTLNPQEVALKYLRPQDIPIGAKVECMVERITEKGINIKVENQFQGLVDPLNISDIKLNYPERKFKVGGKFKGRLLKCYTNGISARLFVTFKKSLVNEEEDEIVKSYEDLTPERKAQATIVKITKSGCVCAFFNDVSAFLPNSEISESFVHSAKDHVKEGQTITVRVVDCDLENKKCLVSLRVSASYTEEQRNEIATLSPGRTICQARVISKERELVSVHFGDSDLPGQIQVMHLSDANEDECRHALKKLKVGSTIEALVLSTDPRNRSIILTAKPSMIKDAKNSVLPVTFNDIRPSDRVLHGFVKAVIPTGVFVSFADGLTGLVISKFASEKPIKNLTMAFQPNQSVKCTVVDTDDSNSRFLLSLRADFSSVDADVAAESPVDKSIKTLGDFVAGKRTVCSVKAVEENSTGLLVKLADNQEGRIDVSEIVDLASLEAGSNAGAFLKKFNKGKKLDVKVLGYRNITNGAFRSTKKDSSDIVELTIKQIDSSDSDRPLSFEDAKYGMEVVGYVHSSISETVLVAVSPNLKVVIPYVDLSEDAKKLANFADSFKVGTIIKASVTKVDQERHIVYASARSSAINTINDVVVGSIIPATIIKVSRSGVIVAIGNGVTARADPADCLDDFDESLEEVFTVGTVVAVKVYDVDVDNQRIGVSLRKSATVKGAKAKDKMITSPSDVKRGDIIRGFIIKFINSGIIVGLGHEVVALVRIGDLSDAFIQDWRAGLTLFQVVTGKILSSEGKGRVLMTMKKSIVTGKLGDNKDFSELKVGQIYEGTIKSTMEYGVFVNLEGTNGLSGLCHRSEISDSKIDNCEDLFSKGDKVKVKILSVDTNRRQMSLGMKASYFMDEDAAENDEDVVMKEDGEPANSDDEAAVEYNNEDSEESSSEDDEDVDDARKAPVGLSAGGLSAGFDWTASVLEQAKDEESEDEEEEFRNQVNKKKSKKVENEDKTADLATRAPQSVSDFERLLIGNPDSSILWIQYMSFQLQLSEVVKAREIAERALKSINYREEHEKLNIWVALLNLENSFGDDDTLEETFKKSCQYMDAPTMHMKMVNIFIASEKYEKADELFNVIIKKEGSKTPAVWVAYADFLIDREQNDEAHAILARALQILPKKNHIEVVRKFAALEFRKGDLEQGRSLFEGLVADVPKRVDLWNIYIDQELKYGDKKHVDDLFERLIERKLTRKQAKYFFGKWLTFEEKMEDEKAQDYVKAKAAEYAEKLSK